MTDASPAGAVPAAAPSDDALIAATLTPPLPAPFHGALSAIWLRELRGRMRGRRAFIFVTIYLAFLVALLWAGLRGVLEVPFSGALDQMMVGRALFMGVILVETLVVVALAPAYTAGLISTEIEKQTFDLLTVTPVSSLAIVLGKLLSGLSYLVLLVGLSIPLASLAYLFGGVAPETMVLGYLLLVLTAVGVGSVGIACSTLLRRTQPATVAAFMTIALVVVGATVTWVLLTERARFDEEQEPPPEALLWLNPFFAQADLLCESSSFLCIPGLTVQGERLAEPGVGPGFPDDGALPNAPAQAPGTFWPKVALSWMLVSGVMILVASQSISPSRRWRPGRPTTAPAKPATTELNS